MNAAARALAHGIIVSNAPTSVRQLTLSKNSIAVFSLVILIVFSALAVITVADINRITFGDLATLQHNRDDLQTTYGQLLLEENTWSSPARVEAIASQTLGMSQPDQQKVIIIKP